MPQSSEVVISHPQFGITNWMVIIFYLVGVLFIGCWVSRRITTTRGFFIAEGKLNYILVGLSILGTYLSTLTMMALPSIAFGEYDWLWTVQLPCLILTAVIITRVVLPRYREAGVISIYEFLEQRIHTSARLLASICFILMSIGRMGLVLYLPALALHTVTGINLPLVIITMGIVVTIYTVMGGMEAVVWTDAIQVIILVFGALLTVGYALGNVASADGNFLAIAHEHHKFRMFDWRLDFKEVVTAWLILQTLFETVRIYGTQQDIAQRYMTTESTAKANRSVWIAIAGYIPLGYMFYFIGTALFVYYKVHPDPNVPALIAREFTDAIYPYFVVTTMPAGISGLIIAAMLAASMSSIDSSMNSSSTVCVEDFYKRFWGRGKSDEHYLKVARWLTLMWGVLATVMALSFIGIKYAQVVWSKVMGISTNGVLGLMALAFLPVRIRWWAAVIGFGACYVVLFYVMFLTKINFLLWPVIGNSVCFLVALILNAIVEYAIPKPSGIR
ncbi:MAG TPA: sodium:solute symporter [Armatimonadetes bacterium]|nr:sodium:solute symporter [Armatimonadota bacterium]